MSAPSEPEKFTIDEMMDRLKTRPAEDPLSEGELVTREDGSQVIKVRKRKRRSHQPHKEELQVTRRARMIQVSAALILLLIVGFAAGAAIIFANSASFREKLVERISYCTGAKVELEQFRVNPTSANAGRLVLTWPETSVLRDLTTRSIRAEIFPSTFLGKSIGGEEVTSGECSLTLRIPAGSANSPASEGDVLPIRFKRYASPKFHVLLGDPSAPLIRMLNSEASFLPPRDGSRAQLILNRGEITVNGWPKLRMDRSHIEFRGNEIDVVGLRIQSESDNRGIFELSGSIAPYVPAKASILAIQLESFQISGLAGPEMGRLFSGRIDTHPNTKSNYLSFTSAADPTPSLAISFRNTLATPLELNGFSFLFGLAQALDDDWFERPSFEIDAGGEFRRKGGILSISEIQFENKDRMAMQGEVSLSPGLKLSGTLNVGITVAMIKASKNRRLDAMFGPPKDGFRWISLQIGGSAAAPTDNFRELYDSVVVKSPESSAEVPTFEELTQPER